MGKPQSYEKCRSLVKSGKPCYSLSDLKKIFRLPPASLKRVVSRLASEKILLRLSRGVYGNMTYKLQLKKLANHLYPPSYVSLGTALHYYGILKSRPRVLSCVTLNRTRNLVTPIGKISFTHCPPILFFGFDIRDGMIIASREKALADYIYFRFRQNQRISSGRLQCEKIKWNSLRTMLLAYPAPVRDVCEKIKSRHS